MATTAPSALERKLKALVRDHPLTSLHPYSPSGPYVQAALWTAEPSVLGQVFLALDSEVWVVRAVDTSAGPETLVESVQPTATTLPATITEVIEAVRALS